MKAFLGFITAIFISVGWAIAEEPKEPPKAELVQEKPKEEKKELTQDEILYIKDLFHNAVLETAVTLSVVIEMSKSGDAVVSVSHPSSSPVVKFLSTHLFKDSQDMEAQIFGTVYAAAANAGQHSLNPQQERTFLRSKISEKIKVDPKFFGELLLVVKDAVK